MKKRHLVAFGLVTIVASLFYAGIWTCESNSLSRCFILSGFTAVGHLMIGCLACAVAECFD